MEENQRLEVSLGWSCMFTQKGASTDDKAAPGKALLVLLLRLGCTGHSWDLPWGSAGTADGREGRWL